MAGVNYLKIKSPAHIGGILSHCASADRDTKDHENKHINKKWSHLNQKIELKEGNGYREYDNAAYYRRFFERLNYLDSQPGANKRKDRVVAFGLEIPCPEDMLITPDELDDERGSGSKRHCVCEWSEKVMDIIAQKYGSANVVAGVVHFDEVHWYLALKLDDHGRKIPVLDGNGQPELDEDGKPVYETEPKLSRPHLHVYVIPEVGGKLNGKKFSSPDNMKDVNERIQVMSLKDYNCKFMDGTRRKSKETVEELKLESERLERYLMSKAGVEDLQASLKAQEIALKARERDFLRKTGNWAKNVDKRLKTASADLERAKNDYESLIKSQRENSETERLREFVGRYKIKGRSMLDIYDEQRAKEAGDVHRRAREAQSSAVGLPDEALKALVSAELITGTEGRQDGSEGQGL